MKQTSRLRLALTLAAFSLAAFAVAFILARHSSLTASSMTATPSPLSIASSAASLTTADATPPPSASPTGSDAVTYGDAFIYQPEQITETPAVSAPAAQEPVYAAATAQPHALGDGVPWYVPSEWHERYLACIANPPYDVSALAWAGSLEAGVAHGWHYADAMYVISKEGGPCSFNLGGSGACGAFQLLTCPPDGLTLEGQLNGALAKFRDGGDSFARHWFAFWLDAE